MPITVDRATYIKTLVSLGHSPEEADHKATEVFFDTNIQEGIPTGLGVLRGEPGRFVKVTKSGQKMENLKGYNLYLGKLGPFPCVGDKAREHILALAKKCDKIVENLFGFGMEEGTRVEVAPLTK